MSGWEQAKPPLIYERLAAVMQDIKAIDKEQNNKTQGFKFRGIDDVLNGVQPYMAKHQVFVTQKILSRERKDIATKSGAVGVHCIYQYQFTFWTIDGSSVETYIDGEGIDYGDKAANKCGSIALKYALINTLMIPTKDVDDPDLHTSPELKYVPDDSAKEPPKPAPTDSTKNSTDLNFIVEKMLVAFKTTFDVDRKTIENFLGAKISNVRNEDLDKLRSAFSRLKLGENKKDVFSAKITDLL